MPTYKVTMGKDNKSTVEVYVDKDNAKQAYNYGIDKGTDIFGAAPDYVAITEQKAVA